MGRADSPAPFSLPQGRAQLKSTGKGRLHVPQPQLFRAVADGVYAFEYAGRTGFFQFLPVADDSPSGFVSALLGVPVVEAVQTVPAGVFPEDANDLLHFYHSYDNIDAWIICVS